ncbi:hypothetical protein [Sphingorhabdus sp. SMR4y]|uniref:hypothetical protein n=1 Tax=Sphingorhabdus sp. SMR4y TaxID=2584094 RepID=UPI000B5F8E1F|nr:hypothetical protein [Sphingorhabdus sp. SMR4y]ASK89811.1 hypothetical protein SPHFLASMR4Y_03078 [Sphingorhabdus sp. SMR4y]
MTLFKLWATAPVLIIMTACSTLESVRPDIEARPLPSRLDETAYINALRDAFEVMDSKSNELCFDGAGLKPFKDKSAQGYSSTAYHEEKLRVPRCLKFKKVPANEVETKMKDYMLAGFGLTDLYCQRFFTITTASERNRRFGESTANSLDVLVNSVLTLSNAGNTAIGITNSGFGLVDKTFEGYDMAYMVSPDIANVQKLVYSAQSEYRERALNPKLTTFPSGYGGARSIIERYANFCTFNGMKALLNESVKNKIDQIDSSLQQNVESAKGKTGRKEINVETSAKNIESPIP